MSVTEKKLIKMLPNDFFVDVTTLSDVKVECHKRKKNHGLGFNSGQWLLL